MGNQFLDIDPTKLANTGASSDNVSSQINDIYGMLKDAVEQVTANDTWRGAAADTFLEKFENLRTGLERDLASLEALGPALRKISGGYENAEAENSSRIGGNYEG